MRIQWMQSEKSWHQLTKNPMAKQQAYIQAEMMAQYFFKTYSKDGFQVLLKELKKSPFKKAFKKITDQNPDLFYRQFLQQYMGINPK